MVRGASWVLAAALAAGTAAGDPPAPAWVESNRQGVEAHRAGRFEDAIVWFRQALAAPEADPTVRLNLQRACVARAREHLRSGQDEPACGLLREAVDLDPADPAALCDLSLAMLRLDRSRQLREILESRRDAFAADADVQGFLGEARSRCGDRAGAIVAWEAALRLRPGMEGIVERLAAAQRDETVEEGYRSRNGSGFAMTYAPSVPPAWRDVLSSQLDRALRSLCGELGHSVRRPIPVVVYPADAFRTVTDGHTWAGGVFDGRIRLPYVPGADAARGEAVVFHEVAHAVLDDIYPDAPAWLHEGIAQEAEARAGSPRPDPHPALRSAAASGALVSWEDLQAGFLRFEDARRAQIAYAQSLAFWGDLQRRLGPGRAPSWLREASRTGIDAATRRALRASPADVYRDWLHRERLEGAGTEREDG